MSDNLSQDIAISGQGNIVVGKGDVIINPLPPAEARLRHDLGILLKNVETTWIKGVLEKSVHQAALLDLGMETREDAVDNPWHMVMEGTDHARETLARGRKIKDIFYEANGLLLILGDPGSGKTTTLLQLARDLITEVDQAFTQPVPVILNLSTWTNKQQPLDQWLIAELNNKYRLPKKAGQSWLTERRILPLLDGLDEVKPDNRAACVEKINQLVSDYGLQGLVVCSRIKDYTDLNVRLAFYRAIYIQPLTNEQISGYLDDAGDKLASLRATLQADEALQSMAQSPLILNIMSLAYQNTSAEALTDPALVTNEARHQLLFDTYIARMFSRKAGARHYEDEQTRQRLSWLARNMQRHNQEVFLIEGFQPSWLDERRWQWVYFLSSRLIGGLIFGLLVGLIVRLLLEHDSRLLFNMFLLRGNGLINEVFPSWGGLSHDLRGLWEFAIKLPLIGLIAGVFIASIDALRFEWLRRRRGMRKPPIFWWLVINIVPIGLLLGFISGLLFEPQHGLLFGMGYAFLFGLRGSRQSWQLDIETVEALRWSWRNALKGGVLGGLIGLLFQLVVGLRYEEGFGSTAQQIYRRLSGLIFGVNDFPDASNPQIAFQQFNDEYAGISARFYGFTLGLMFAILYGLRREIIETKSIPNQGIRLSLRSAIFGGLVFGLIGGLLFGWGTSAAPALMEVLLIQLSQIPLSDTMRNAAQSVVRSAALSTGLSNVLLYALGFGLTGALWYGGLDIIQHYILRLIFLIQGHTPANYVDFLDYAADRIFLQKVGGGYRFIHRLLLEHFANMGDPRKV